MVVAAVVVMNKKQILNHPIEHIDIKSFDSSPIIKRMDNMSFSSKDLADACRIYNQMLADPDCTIFLTIAGSSSAAGCMQIFHDMVAYNMVDVVVATGATLIDMHFHEDLGHRHYQGNPHADDEMLGKLLIDRIYSVYIDEEELKETDETIYRIAKEFAKQTNVCSSRQFLREIGRWLSQNDCEVENSLIQSAYYNKVPLFCPAFSDCSAGFGLVKLQAEAIVNDDIAVSIDSVADFHELTQVKIASKKSGIIIIGGGSPNNFALDSVICSEVLGKPSPPFDYCVKISVADPRDGGLSGSTLKELGSWRKANTNQSQQATVFSEITMSLPLLASNAYHTGYWKYRTRQNYNDLFNDDRNPF